MKKKISQSTKQKILSFKEQQQIYNILKGFENLQKFVNSLPDLDEDNKNIKMQNKKISKERVIKKYKSKQQKNKLKSAHNSFLKKSTTENIKKKIVKQINIKNRLKRLE